MARNKRQTFGKMQRERQRAEKRALKQEKKDAKKAAAVAGLEAETAGSAYPVPGTEDAAPDAVPD